MCPLRSTSKYVSPRSECMDGGTDEILKPISERLRDPCGIWRPAGRHDAAESPTIVSPGARSQLKVNQYPPSA